MKRILVDLNVILDVLFDRAPHAAAAAGLWTAVEKKAAEAFVAAHGFTTLFYLAARKRDAAFARRVVADLVTVFHVAPVDEAVIRRALALTWHDFEDSVCAAAAEACACDFIVTRDPSGFRDSPVPVIDPASALALLRTEGGGPDRLGEATRAPYSSDRRVKAPRPRRPEPPARKRASRPPTEAR